MDEHDKIVLRDYLGEYWSKFVDFCEERGGGPEAIYVALGGEPD